MTTPGRISNDRSSTAVLSPYFFVNPCATIMRHFRSRSAPLGAAAFITVPAVEDVGPGSAGHPREGSGSLCRGYMSSADPRQTPHLGARERPPPGAPAQVGSRMGRSVSVDRSDLLRLAAVTRWAAGRA